ncbi:MAG: hypothetical protein ABSA41_12535 [Terriglobia bacterium]|jgi:hypothetical protein
MKSTQALLLLIFGVVGAALIYEFFTRTAKATSGAPALTSTSSQLAKLQAAGVLQPSSAVQVTSALTGLFSSIGSALKNLGTAPIGGGQVETSQLEGSTIYTESPGYIGVEAPGLTLGVAAPTTVTVDTGSLIAPTVEAADPMADTTTYDMAGSDYQG